MTGFVEACVAVAVAGGPVTAGRDRGLPCLTAPLPVCATVVRGPGAPAAAGGPHGGGGPEAEGHLRVVRRLPCCGRGFGIRL